jgi:hypothetical protein
MARILSRDRRDSAKSELRCYLQPQRILSRHYPLFPVKKEIPAYKIQARRKNAMQISLFTNGKTNTKSVMKANISLTVAAMLLTAALAVPAAAQKHVPFKGSLQGQETDTPPGSGMVDGSTTGIATLVGQFSFSYQLTVNLANGTSTGSARLIAANGDSVNTTITGSSELTATPGVLSITEINTITGGTGRFASAQGSFIVERLVNLGTGFTSGSLHGTITSPGAAH